MGREISIVCPALPGFDNARPIKKSLNMNDYLLWLNKLIDRSSSKKTILVGHSNGGRIAVCYCAKYQNKIEKMILINSSGIKPKNYLKTKLFGSIAKYGKKILNVLKNEKLKKIAENLLYKAARESDYYVSPPHMKKTLQNMLKTNTEPLLSEIKCPVCLIWGKNDKVTPLWMGETMHKLLKKSRLHLVKDGHNIHQSNPETLAKYIYNCLQ